ncbi:MAG: hypothetical protein HRT45_08685 [Bdellovibrionales bacterium]|nr:hypothetical protein [Bdellovibrionales bacterium]
MYVDGPLSESWSDGTANGTVRNTTKMIIGKGPKDNANNRGWNGRILEVIYFNTALTNAERDQVMDYLQGKWGI